MQADVNAMSNGRATRNGCTGLRGLVAAVAHVLRNTRVGPCLCLLLTCCSSLLAQVQHLSGPDAQRLQHASAALDAGDLEAASKDLEALHQRYPELFEVNELGGLCYAAQERYASAVPLLAAAAKERPGSDVAHANLGSAYLKLGQLADSAQQLQQAAKLNPANASTQETLGQVLMLLHRPQEAAAAFGIALQTDTANADLIYNAALALYESDQAAAAERLLEGSPDVAKSAQAQSLLGDVEEKLGHYQEAIQHDSNAAHLDPSEANIYSLGLEFLLHWTFQPAADTFAAGVRLFPDSKRMRLALATTYYADTRYDKALPILTDLLNSDPQNKLYSELLGRACTAIATDIDQACTALVSFAESHPENGVADAYAATLLQRRAEGHELDEAEKLLQEAEKAAPDLPEAPYQLGLLLQTKSQWELSIPELQKAIRLRPEYASAHYRLALAYNRTGQHDKAQAEVALQQRYSAKETQDVYARLQQITKFLVNTR